MGTIVEDVKESAGWVAEALSSSGYEADFDPNSLIEIDRFFLEHSEDGQAVPGGLLADSVGQRLFAIGSYIGEVIRRSAGGEWRGDDSDPEAEINVELELADGTICWPVQRAIKRFKDGPGEGIAAYGSALGLTYTRSAWPDNQDTKEKPWWKFW